MHNSKVKYPDFGLRMNQAADANPHVPPENHGRLQWVADEMTKLGHEMVMETARKWFAGETMPRNEGAKLLAQVMQVDPAWLTLGQRSTVSTKDQKQRNALASGAVNLIAGMIQMAGWNVAFPTSKGGPDIQAIIRGAMYSMHVVVGEQVGGDWDFSVPSEAIDYFIIGVCRVAPFQFVLIELDQENLLEKGRNKGGTIEVTVHEDFEGWRQIKTFAERL